MKVKETPNEQSIKIDQTKPEITALAYEKIGIMKYRFTATVNDETSGINRVEFYLSGIYLGNATEAPYELEYSGDAKYHILSIIVYDNAGNTATKAQQVSYDMNVIQQVSHGMNVLISKYAEAQTSAPRPFTMND
jgi:hypothetical protein